MRSASCAAASAAEGRAATREQGVHRRGTIRERGPPRAASGRRPGRPDAFPTPHGPRSAAKPSLPFSILTRGRLIERYARVPTSVNRDAHESEMPYEPFERVAHRADGAADHAPRARRGIDRRALPAGRATTTRSPSSGTPGRSGSGRSTSRRCTAMAPPSAGWARASPGGRATSSCCRRRSVASSCARRRPHRPRGPRPPGSRRPGRRVLHGHRGPPRRVRLHARTASGARSTRASSASASTGSTSPTSTTPTTTGRRRSRAPTRRSTGCARRASSARSARG